MKINEKTFCFGSKVLLVPYSSHHVPKYHDWMSSPELQQLTASEPLSLAEEYNMEEQWRQDEDKCTFIILDAKIYESLLKDKMIDREIESMVGDVNLFLNDSENKHTAEIEIMIAETSARGKGLGKDALLSMMRFGMDVLHLTQITAKIGLTNEPSLAMFNKIGFNEVSRSEVFQEVTLELNIDAKVRNMLQTSTPQFRLKDRSCPS